MIRSFEVKLNAAHPELPLMEASAIVGSTSTAFISRVPASIGSWHITRVYVQAEYPDGTTTTVAATMGAAGIYTATLPATQTSGRVRGGFCVLADGIDELGEPVTGYILGMADMAVYTRDLTVIPGFNGVAMHYFDNAPTLAKKGDVAPFDGVLKMYDGAQWVAFGAEVDLSDYYTKEETDEAIERVAAYYITADAQGDAFETYAALAGASTYYSGGAVRTPTRNDYAVVLADETHGGAEWRYIYAIADGATSGQWEAQYPIETNDYTALANKPQVNGHMLTGNQSGADLGLATTADATLTAYNWGWQNVPSGVQVYDPVWLELPSSLGCWTVPAVIDGRSTTLYLDFSTPSSATTITVPITRDGQVVTMVATLKSQPYYRLGEQYDKPLASEAEAEAIRTALAGKQATISASGLLKGDGEGNVSAAEAGTDYQTPITVDATPTQSSTNPVQSGGVYASLSGKADAAALRYALGTTITASSVMADRTCNSVIAAADNTADILLSFPPTVTGKARDFVVLITNTTGNTGDITFVMPSGATVYGDAFTTPCGSGETWLYSFTEVAPNKFFSKAQQAIDPFAPKYWGLYFEAEEAGVVINMTRDGMSVPTTTLETSTDGETWTTFDTSGSGTTPITLANIGDRVYFRAGSGGNTYFGSANQYGHTFTISKRCGAHGNIMSLLDANGENAKTLPYVNTFCRLFDGCTNLTSAPLLPATTLKPYCYYLMFNGCTSLVTPPDLPATDLYPYSDPSSACYQGMFKGCTSLAIAPALPATTLAPNCYTEMFQGCTALTEAPDLPATNLPSACYGAMFYNCSSLARARVAFTAWASNGQFSNWMYHVASTGTFVCPTALGTNDTIWRDVNTCPVNWTVINY